MILLFKVEKESERGPKETLNFSFHLGLNLVGDFMITIHHRQSEALSWGKNS